MLLKSKKRLTAYVLAALCVASTGFAATEHWNDASTTPNAVVATQVGDANWEQWKTSWESIKNDYEQVSMAPGKDATQMNFAWYSKDKAKASEIRISTNADCQRLAPSSARPKRAPSSTAHSTTPTR